MVWSNSHKPSIPECSSSNRFISLIHVNFSIKKEKKRKDSENCIYAGLRNGMSGYESLVEAARVASQKFNPIQQREVVIKALERAFPRPILYLVSPFNHLPCFFYIEVPGLLKKTTCIFVLMHATNYVS